MARSRARNPRQEPKDEVERRIEETPEQVAEIVHRAMEGSFDPLGNIAPILHAQVLWALHPVALWSKEIELGKRNVALMRYVAQRLSGQPAEPPFVPEPYDIRWDHPVWTESVWWSTLQQGYFGWGQSLVEMVRQTPAIDERERRRAVFWTGEFVNALAPTNFFWTNPKARELAAKTWGLSLVEGYKNFLSDMAAGMVRMTRPDDFHVGVNLATTPGDVVHRNGLVEIIRYAPTRPQVHRRPVVIVPPWINKFYVLDLTPDKSLVKYLCDQGFEVFIISWKNPTREMANTTFDDYLMQGVDVLVETARSITGADKVNAVGYCIGGTALASYLAVMNRKLGADACPVADATFFTTLVDFSAPGDIEVFIDPATVDFLCRKMQLDGYLRGEDMAEAFRLLRSNSLIWRYIVHGWLYGEEPEPFDVLYWNMDPTRMPAKMHCWYLREFYLNNRLIQPDALTLAGVPVDLRQIVQPVYAVGTEDDHIAPWQQTFKLMRHVRGPRRYVLSSSGHILGIVNPPKNPPKRKYWVSDLTDPVPRADSWLKSASEHPHPNSWWGDWVEWLRPQAGELVTPKDRASVPSLGSAPGTYVLEH